MRVETHARHLLFNSAAAGLDYILSLADTRYAGGMLCTALHRPEGAADWMLLCARLVLSPSVEFPRPARCYPGLLLIEEWLPRDKVFSCLSVEGQNLVFEVAGDHASRHLFEYSSGERRDTQNHVMSHSGFAETEVYFESRPLRQINVDHRPAVAVGAPPYVSISDAAADWCLGKRARDTANFNDRGRLLVVAPEVRARIDKAVVRNGLLSLEVKTNAETRGEVQVVFGALSPWDAPAEDVRVESRLIREASSNLCQFEVPGEATVVNIYVVDESSALMAHFSSWRETIEAPDSRASNSHGAESEVAEGENEQVEMKPWPSKSDQRNNKLKEMTRTVVAFANTHGGRLYVGVDDDLTPQGLAPLASVGATPDAMLDEVRRILDREFRNGIVPVPRFTISTALVRGQSVMIVRVEKGTRTPYATTNSEIYIRKGASSRRPDPHSELPSLIRPSGYKG